jgi:hypothetical protein
VPLVKMKAGEQAGLRKLDTCNAFQEFDRSDVMRLIAANEGDAAYVRQVEAWGGGESMSYGNCRPCFQ